MSSKSLVRLLAVAIALVVATRADAAIAFDNKASCGSGTSTATCSSFVVAATNPAIVVGATSSLGDNLTSCTFNGVSMTQVGKKVTATGVAYRYLYLLTANSGTHDVVCTSSSGTTYADVVSLTGANQSNTPDASASNSCNPCASVDISVTVVAANCWLVVAGENDAVASVGFSNQVSSRQVNSSYGGIAMGDSNGTVGTGAQLATLTGATANLYGVAASIAPAGGAATCNGSLLLLGAGGCH